MRDNSSWNLLRKVATQRTQSFISVRSSRTSGSWNNLEQLSNRHFQGLGEFRKRCRTWKFAAELPWNQRFFRGLVSCPRWNDYRGSTLTMVWTPRRGLLQLPQTGNTGPSFSEIRARIQNVTDDHNRPDMSSLTSPNRVCSAWGTVNY